MNRSKLSLRRLAQQYRLPWRWLWPALLVMGGFLFIGLAHLISQSWLYEGFSALTFWIGERYGSWFSHQKQLLRNPLTLTVLSFAGGLVASISPCILSLLPVNLSYIGTRDITSRQDAALKAGAFVLGVATILSLLGIFSSSLGLLFQQYRGYLQLLVGVIILGMGLSLLGLWHWPRWLQLPRRSQSTTAADSEKLTGLRGVAPITVPFGVGVTFALVSSPCSSPILFAVLAAAAESGSQFQSVVAMVSYAIGYTAIIFLASLFTGLAKQTRALLGHTETINWFASLVLLIIGCSYVLSGGQWIWAMWQVMSTGGG